jgi:hypothetical protein
LQGHDDNDEGEDDDDDAGRYQPGNPIHVNLPIILFSMN